MALTNAVLDTQHYGDNSMLYRALDTIEAKRKALPSGVQGSADLSKTYSECISKIRAAIDKSTVSPAAQSDKVLKKGNTLETAWRTKSACPELGYNNTVTINDLLGFMYKNVAFVNPSEWKSSLDRYWDQVSKSSNPNDLEVYKFYSHQGSDVVRQVILQRMKAKSGLYGQSSGRVWDALNARDKNGNLSPLGQDMSDLVNTVSDRVRNILSDSAIQDKAGALDDMIFKVSLPYMTGYNALTTKVQEGFAGIGGYNSEGVLEMMDSGAFKGAKDSATGDYIMPPQLEARRNELLGIPAVQKAIKPLQDKGYTLVDNERGDIWFGTDGGKPKVGDVRYSLDKPEKGEKDFGLHKYVLAGNGQWERDKK
jgi:hypothetical protein